ncbi:response regulator transcription factor [Streptomyces sp. NPDC059063]|uniref:helix-turn-helix transcriptional regulator n=1 Tax=Streptomyces sp. NPDC059063 TaxID=3346712 RepID=UPI0036A25F64
MSTSSQASTLTRCQIGVIARLARGDSSECIAADLALAPDAVRSHIRRAAARTGLDRLPQAQLVDYAYRHGYLPALPAEHRRYPETLPPSLLAVLQGTARGLSLNEMARELRVSRGTVHEYRRRLHAQLNARTRGHAVALGWQAGLLTHAPADARGDGAAASSPNPPGPSGPSAQTALNRSGMESR